MKKAIVSLVSIILALCVLAGNFTAFAGDWDTDPICLEHSYSRVLVKKATMSQDGSIALQCSKCKAIESGSEQRIARIQSVTLSQEKYIYDGSEKKPAVVVKDVDGKTIAADNYTVEYFDNIHVDRDTYALVTFKGNYEGSVKKAFVISWDTEPVCANHNFVRTLMQKATGTHDGYTAMLCSNCQEVQEGSEQKIARIASVTLSATSFFYDAKAKTPAVVVKDSAGKTIAAKYYRVNYVNNVKVGQKSYANITFNTNYSGDYNRYFNIYLAKPAVKVLTSANAVKLSWSKVPGAKYYRVYEYNASTKKYKGLGNTAALSYLVKNRKPGTQYYFLVRAYFINAAKKEVLSPYTVKNNVKALTLCAAPTVKAGVSGKKVVLKWNAVAGAKYYRVYEYNAKTKRYITLVSKTTATALTLSNRSVGTHYYLVRAFNANNLASAFTTKNLVKAVIKNPTTASQTVYITKTGKRYHYDSKCGNGTYYKSTLAKALKLGLTPCQKCVHN
ncbi:MAG: hypothetical protein IJJ41_03085 [Clostridia bacterium]|nr:hypothetical protein [Clostridia bacterium]